MTRRKYSTLKGAFTLAMLYLPLLAISDLIEAFYPFDSTAAVYILPAFSGLLSFCVLISESMTAALKKWALSIPFTLAFWYVLAATDFSVRLTNMLYPGYGSLSAGSGFSFMADFAFLSISQGIADLLAVSASSMAVNRFQRPRSVMQEMILPIISVIIFFVVLYLEFTMPTTDQIYQSVYG